MECSIYSNLMITHKNRDYSAAELQILLQKINEDIHETLLPDNRNHIQHYYQNFTSISLRTLKYVNIFLNSINSNQSMGTVIDSIISKLTLTLDQHKNRLICPKDDDDAQIVDKQQERDKRQDQLYHFINTRGINSPIQCLPNAQVERQRLQLIDFVQQINQKYKVPVKTIKRSIRLSNSNNNRSLSKIIKTIEVDGHHIVPIKKQSHFKSIRLENKIITYNKNTQTQSTPLLEEIPHLSLGSKNDLMDYNLFNFGLQQINLEQKTKKPEQKNKLKNKSKRKKQNININNVLKSNVNQQRLPKSKTLISSFKNTQRNKQIDNKQQQENYVLQRKCKNLLSSKFMKVTKYNLHLCQQQISISIFKIHQIKMDFLAKQKQPINQGHRVDQNQTASDNYQNDKLSSANHQIKIIDNNEKKSSLIIQEDYKSDNIQKYISSPLLSQLQAIKNKGPSKTYGQQIENKSLKNKMGEKSLQIYSRYSEKIYTHAQLHSHSPSMILKKSEYENSPSFGLFVRNSKLKKHNEKEDGVIRPEENLYFPRAQLKQGFIRQRDNLNNTNKVDNKSKFNQIQQNRKVLLSQVKKGIIDEIQLHKSKQMKNYSNNSYANGISLNYSEERFNQNQCQNSKKSKNQYVNQNSTIDRPYYKCLNLSNEKIFDKSTSNLQKKPQINQQISSKSYENSISESINESTVNTKFQSGIQQQKSKLSIKQIGKILKQENWQQKQTPGNINLRLTKADKSQLFWNMRTRGRRQKVRQYLELIQEVHRKFCGNECPHFSSLTNSVKEETTEGLIMIQLLELLRK